MCVSVCVYFCLACLHLVLVLLACTQLPTSQTPLCLSHAIAVEVRHLPVLEASQSPGIAAQLKMQELSSVAGKARLSLQHRALFRINGSINHPSSVPSIATGLLSCTYDLPCAPSPSLPGLNALPHSAAPRCLQSNFRLRTPRTRRLACALNTLGGLCLLPIP